MHHFTYPESVEHDTLMGYKFNNNLIVKTCLQNMSIFGRLFMKMVMRFAQNEVNILQPKLFWTLQVKDTV